MSASATPSRPKWHLPLLWTRGIVLTIVILSAVIVFGAIGLWITQGDLIAEKASEYLNRRVFDNQQTRISLGNVSGFPMRDLRIDNALFEQKVGEDWVPFVAADTLKLEYDLWAIVNGRYQIQKVVGQGLEFRLKESPDGGYSLPALQGKSESNQPSSFALDLDALEIRDGAVELDIPGMPTKFEGVDAEMTFLVRGSQIHLDFRRFRAETFNDSLGTIAFNQGALTINPGIVMKDFDGVWNEARVQMDGIPTPAEDRPGTLQIEAVNLPLAQVGGLYNLPHMDPGHVERGEIDLRFSEAGVAFTATGAFLWEGVPIDVTEAEARLTDTSFQITALQAKARGATVRGGTISLPRDDNSLNLSVDLEEFDPRDFEFLPENFQVPGSFTGEVNLRVPDRTRMNEYLYAVARLEAGRLYEIPYRSAFLNLQGGAATGWQIDSVLVELSDARFNGRGRYGETRTNLRLNYLGNFRPLRELLNLEELRGDGVVAATLKGPAKALRMEAQGTLWNLNVANLEIPELRLMKAAGPITGERNFEMDFETKAPFIMAGQHVNQAQGKLLLKSDRLLMDNLALSQGDTTLVVTGEMMWEPNLLIEATTAKANFGDREFVLVRPARLEFDGKRFTSPGLELETPKGKLSVGGAFEPESKYVRCSLSMEDLNPQAVLGPDMELPITFTQVSGELNLEGFIPILDGEANVRLGPLKTDKTGLDSLEASFRVRGSTVQVERITATRGGGVIGVTGEVEMPAPLYTVLEAEVFGPDLDPDATKWNLNANISDVRLSEWLSFIERDERPYGELNASLYMGGTSLNPVLDLKMESRNLTWRKFQSDSLWVSVGVEGGIAQIDSLVMRQVRSDGQAADLTGRVLVTGSVPVNYSLKPLTANLGEGDMALRVHAPDADLSNLQVTPWIDGADGTFTTDLAIGGTVRRPLIDGELRVQGKSIDIRGRDEVLEDVHAFLIFEGGLVRVLEADARLGGGIVTAVGTYRLYADELESYELRINANRIVARERGRYAARASGNLTLVPTRGSDGNIYPMARGKLEVDRAEYVGTLQPQDIQSLERQPLLYDVEIVAPQRIFVETEDLKAEMSADLRIRQEPDRRIIQGEARILNGTYQLFLRRFRITDGVLRWTNPNDIMPEMDVTAETVDRQWLISIRWTGKPLEPTIEFTARDRETNQDLAVSKEAIIRRLAIGSIGASSLADSEASTGDQTVTGLIEGSQLLLRQLERGLLEQVGFFDDIQISPDLDAEGRYRFELRKWLTPQLSIRYEQGLNRYFDPDIALEYRLRQALILRGESIRERSANDASISQQYNLDLRIRHEY